MLNISEVIHKDYSNGEKERFQELIKVIVNLSNKVHSHGLLSLSEIYPSLQPFLLRKGIELMVEGFNSGDLRFILDNYIECGNYFDDELLERLIIKEGLLLLIDDKNNGRILFEKILSMFGENFFEDFDYSIFDEKTFIEENSDHEENISNRLDAFEDKVMSIVYSKDMEKLIMKAGLYNMAIALKGSSPHLQNHVKDLSSKYIHRQMEYMSKFIGPCRLEDVKSTQKFVLSFL